jgi:superfamily II DNA or RNA helicase
MTENPERTYINYHGYILRKQYFTEEELVSVRKDLTVEPKVHPDFKREDTMKFTIYKENANKLYLPRYYGLAKFGVPETNELPEGDDINIVFEGGLRPIQEPIIERVLEVLRITGGGSIAVNPAMGKTVMAIYLICQLKKKAIIICHKDFLISQWIERIGQFAPAARIGVIKGSKCITHDKDIVVGSIQTLWSKDIPESIMKSFGICVYDEAHHVSARQFHKALQKTNLKYTLALSATPERADGLERVGFWYLGDICYRQDIKDKPKETVHVKVYEYNNNDPKYCKMEFNVMKKPNNAKMITNIAECERRSKFILGLIPPLIADGRKIIMLTERISHVDWFMIELPKIGVDCGRYVGGMKQQHLDAAQDKPVLISSFQMVLEGFDNSTLDTLIWCTPKAGLGGLEQGIGRILRKQAHLRTQIPLVIDVADMFGMFRNKGFQRRKFYRKHGYQVQIINVDDTNPNREHALVAEQTGNGNTDGNVARSDDDDTTSSDEESSSSDNKEDSTPAKVVYKDPTNKGLVREITPKEKAIVDAMKRMEKAAKKELAGIRFSDE